MALPLNLVYRSRAIQYPLIAAMNACDAWERAGIDLQQVTYVAGADKSDPKGIRERVDKGFTSGASLGSSLSLYRVEAVATVVQVDRDKHELTLRGPTRTVTLQASAASLLDGLKPGDSVKVDYVEATAVQITRDGMPLR